ncbi:MAG TPA: efflux transporter outer membrane subunit [Steroidobacteraceae bacterium]|nr:efflux transporter outer membrane subunit [Steroidobacteraceae bacterium]
MSARTRCRAIAAASLYLLAGCAVGPNFHRPDAPPVTTYTHRADPTETAAADGTAQRFQTGGALSPDWWRLFQSSKLDAVIAEAIANNPGLDAAQASLRASQDTLRSGYGIFYPAVDANAGAARERYSSANIGGKSPGGVFNLFTLSTSVSYALDIFGGQRRLVEGLHAEVDLARANEQAAYLSLTSNIVNTVIARAAYRAEVNATKELIDLQKEQVRLAEIQAQAGTVAYSAVLSLRSQLASTQATIPQLQQRSAQSAHLLAALTGHVPAQWQTPDVSLKDLTLPVDVPVSLPSALVGQRPDILAAEAVAHAASANIGVATAALLPSFTLGGSIGAATNSTGMLFPANGKTWSIGADATAPLFEGGTLWFKRKAALNNYSQAMALYRQTVLGAFEQVADCLRALDHDAQTLQAEAEALAAAGQALRLIQANYRAGLATYLDVLIADTQYHQTAILDLEAIAVRYQDTVALFAALGGGWWNERTGANAAAPDAK